MYVCVDKESGASCGLKCEEIAESREINLTPLCIRNCEMGFK